MRKIMTCFIILFGLLCSLSVNAGGGITHMFIAEESIPLIVDAKLRNILQDNLDAFLVGAHYPDSGYVPGTGYGEDSHWDPFIFAFADYLKEKYQNPGLENPKLVAFLMGCAVHRVSDEIIHFTFYHYVAEKDFNGKEKKGHIYGDIGIDLLLNIDQSRWTHQPKVWWVPVSDLVQVYHRMGKDEYTAEQIIYGNSVLSMAGLLERAMSIPSYTYLRLRMPWTAKNYYDWPEGGMLMDIKQVSHYLNHLWYRLHDTQPLTTSNQTDSIPVEHDVTILELSQQILDNQIAKIVVQPQPDGSVELQSPMILNENKFKFYTLQNIINE